MVRSSRARVRVRDALGVMEVLEGISFQLVTLAHVPWMYSCLPERRLHWAVPSESSNATTRDNLEPGEREEGGQIQLGFWVIVRAV